MLVALPISEVKVSICALASREFRRVITDRQVHKEQGVQRRTNGEQSDLPSGGDLKPWYPKPREKQYPGQVERLPFEHVGE